MTQEHPNPPAQKKFHPDSSCGNTGSGSGMSSIGCPPATYPFELSLINVIPETIPSGGETIALLRLRNIGHEPASVPWNTDWDQIERPDETGTYKYFQADLRADFDQDGGGGYFSIPVHLYGTEKASGSLLRINPGEWVEIKVKLVLDCKHEDLKCEQLKAGESNLSFTLTECDQTEIYKKYSADSRSTRLRELSSSAVDVEVIQTTAPK